MKRIYEYDICSHVNPMDVVEEVNQAITNNDECQPYGNLVVTCDSDGVECFHQVVVYAREVK